MRSSAEGNETPVGKMKLPNHVLWDYRRLRLDRPVYFKDLPDLMKREFGDWFSARPSSITEDDADLLASRVVVLDSVRPEEEEAANWGKLRYALHGEVIPEDSPLAVWMKQGKALMDKHRVEILRMIDSQSH